MQTVAVGVLVTARTHQAGWTGLVAAAAFLPIGLLSPVGGAVADRIDRRRWLMLTTLGEAALALVLSILAATGQDSPVAVTFTVLAGGAMAAVGFPAYQAMLPDLVETDELLSAVSLSSAQFNLGRVIGPALAGVVIIASSYTWAFAINAASFLAVVVALVFVRPRPSPHRPEEGTLAGRLVSGAKAAAADPGCRAAITLIAVVALLASPFIALVPAVAIKLFHRGAGGTAVLVTAQGIGAVGGALVLAPAAQRLGRRRLLVADLFLLPSLLVLYALAPSLAVAAVLLFAVGASYIGVLSGLNTVVQLRAPPRARARVLGLYMMALGTIYPLGAIAQGSLGDHLGMRAVTVGCAVLLAGFVALYALTRPRMVRGLGDPLSARASPPTPADQASSGSHP